MSLIKTKGKLRQLFFGAGNIRRSLSQNNIYPQNLIQVSKSTAELQKMVD